MKTLEAATRDFAANLKRSFSRAIADSPRDFKKQVIHLIRRELPPRPGRPLDPRLDAAAHLVQRGRTIRQVLRIQLTGFEQMDPYARYLSEKGLRAAIARRRAHRSATKKVTGTGQTQAQTSSAEVLGRKPTS